MRELSKDIAKPIIVLFVVVSLWYMFLLISNFYSIVNRPSYPLHEAALNWAVSEIRRLVGAGVNVNELDDTGSTPLREALIGNQFDAASELIKLGADLNLETKRPWQQTKGMTVIEELSKASDSETFDAQFRARARAALEWLKKNGHMVSTYR
jgi:hypothetical protein